MDALSTTLLEQAVLSGHLEVVSALLGLEAKVAVKVVMAAAENYENGKEFMTLLLDRRGEQIVITEEVISITAACGLEKLLHFFLQKSVLPYNPKWIAISNLYNAAAAGQAEG
ncbi:hypothetical protein F4824DRAFT_496233 [Ustulina deusta]|nr:hypothetical protein F4824DRAFT_496233 [Ustulina deusta]